MRLLAPKTKQSYLFLAPLHSGLGKAVVGIYPGRAMQLDALAFLPHPTDITDIAPPPTTRLRSLWSASLSSGSDQRRIRGCGTRWLLAGPDSLPLWLCRVYGVCAFVLLRCFSCSHTVLPKEHSLGVIFFSPHFPHVYAVFFFNSTCISLLIILCMIVYVTNNKEPWRCFWRCIRSVLVALFLKMSERGDSWCTNSSISSLLVKLSKVS